VSLPDDSVSSARVAVRNKSLKVLLMPSKRNLLLVQIAGNLSLVLLLLPKCFQGSS